MDVVIRLSLILFFFFVFSNQPLRAHNIQISIEEALRKKLVSATFTSLAGHSGYCIESQIVNNQNQEISLFFEPGRIIDSKEDKFQNILLTKKIETKILAFQKKSVQLFGFCCQINNASPFLKCEYKLGKMADSGLVKIAQFFNENNFDDNTQQYAIWCISDQRSLESIPQTFDNCSEELINLCSRIRKLPNPTSCFTYLDVPNQMFSNIKSHYKTQIKYSKKEKSKLMIAIVDSLGNTIKVIADNNFSERGNYNYLINVSVYNWKKGKYFLRIFEGQSKEFERTFEI